MSNLALVGLLCFLHRRRSLSSSSPVNAPIRSGVRFRSGIAQIWPVSSKPMDSSRAFPQRRSDVSYSTVNSSRGALICGSPLKCLMMSSRPGQVQEVLSPLPWRRGRTRTNRKSIAYPSSNDLRRCRCRTGVCGYKEGGQNTCFRLRVFPLIG